MCNNKSYKEILLNYFYIEEDYNTIYGMRDEDVDYDLFEKIVKKWYKNIRGNTYIDDDDINIWFGTPEELGKEFYECGFLGEATGFMHEYAYLIYTQYIENPWISPISYEQICDDLLIYHFI